VAQQVAFVPEGYLRWMTYARPKGAPAVREVQTAKGTADMMREAFQEQVKRWGGCSATLREALTAYLEERRQK
jgi:hypothetical protein